LDHNRALTQLAEKSKVKLSEVKNVIIWGNHSSTQYPDVTHGTISGKPINTVVTDTKYLQEEFITTVQKRGAAIIEARKNSSAVSAAKAARDHIHTWMFGTAEGEWVSMGVIVENNTYGIDKNLCFSYPVKCKDFKYEIVPGLAWDEFSKKKIEATQKELQEERMEALGI
jgi:malate/lactate dehydrogenase